MTPTDRETIEQIKGKFRSNYMPRTIVSVFFLSAFLIYGVDIALLVPQAIHFLLCIVWIVMVELETPAIFNERLRYLRITLDVVALTIMLYFAGGLSSYIFFGYIVFITLTSLYITSRYAIYAIILCSALFNTMLYLTHAGIVPYRNIFSDSGCIAIPITTTNVIVANVTLLTFSIVMHRFIHLGYRSNAEKTKQLEQQRATLESELALARSIQERLMPNGKPTPYIASRYRPMQQVGGDFFDFIRIDDRGGIGIFISDVSGHGVPAAFITSMVKTIILQAGERAQDPAGFLLYVNDVLQGQISGNFVTAFYGIYDPASRTLRYANAGHHQPYVITADGAHQLQGGRNTAIAMFPNNMLASHNRRYHTREEVLPAGCKLLLYTDGLVEARPVTGEGPFYEYGPMLNDFTRLSWSSCEDFIEGLYESLVSFRGSESFDDDVCLVCLDVT